MTRRSYIPSRFALLTSLPLSLAVPCAAWAQSADEDVELTVQSAPATTSTPATTSAPATTSTPASSPLPSSSPLPVGEGQGEGATSAPAHTNNAEVAALRARLDALEAKVASGEAAAGGASVAPSPQPSPKGRGGNDGSGDGKEKSFVERLGDHGLSLSGYIQVQYTNSELSQNELLQGGTPLNQNRFAVRRGRLRLRGCWKYARTDFEIDGSNTRGPTASVRRAAISGVLPNEQEGALPWLVLTAGLTEIPLGLELQQRQNEILFLERTTGSLAMFAGPVDTGAKLESALGAFRIQLAAMNGVPLDDRAGGPSGIDPTKQPDFIGRVGVDTRPLEELRIAAGASLLTGKGFHPGSDATKGTIQWNDTNANGTIDTGELTAVAGRGALPSKTFDHWAVNADLEVDVHTRVGFTRLYAEATLATNLDRALYVADPYSGASNVRGFTGTGDDIRELNWYVAAMQDVTQWGFAGLRYEVYDPNSDLIDSKAGKTVPADATITTISPILGARWPGLGRLTFQYDVIDDHLARDRRGVPTDLKNDQWTLRAQGEF